MARGLPTYRQRHQTGFMLKSNAEKVAYHSCSTVATAIKQGAGLATWQRCPSESVKRRVVQHGNTEVEGRRQEWPERVRTPNASLVQSMVALSRSKEAKSLLAFPNPP